MTDSQFKREIPPEISRLLTGFKHAETRLVEHLNSFLGPNKPFSPRIQLDDFIFHWTNWKALEQIRDEGLHPRLGGSTSEELPELFELYLADKNINTEEYMTKDLEIWSEKYPEIWEEMIQDRTGIYTTLNPSFWDGEEEDQMLLLIDRSELESTEDFYFPMTEIFYTPIQPERIWILDYHQQTIRSIHTLTSFLLPQKFTECRD